MAPEPTKTDPQQDDADDVEAQKLLDAASKTEDPKPKPPWGDDENFNPERAWKLIQNLQVQAKNPAAKKELEQLRTKIKEYEEANLTEKQRLEKELEEAKTSSSTTGADLLKIRAAMAKAPEGMSPSKILTMSKRLTGNTPEELETDAEELFADFAPASTRPPSKVPAENLKGGGEPDKDPEPDPDKIVANLLKRRRGF